ncbi:MAG TPA: class I SAM-dependent methyltransferase [Solirubrobacter sp.]|nr:class I SAM-dependent methyltransferase [Solirubrobacter sp.]
MELLSRPEWQMAPGERAAIAGVLAELRPRLAIEIGTAQGGSLRTIAAYSEEVHSFDFAAQVADPPRNVTLHAGDSHELLPALLRSFAQAGRSVDFALVDGDHSAEGVRRDVVDLLSSDAVTNAVILLHDTANAQVRAGLAAAGLAGHPKVRMVDLAFVELQRPTAVLMEEWGGLGLVVVGPDDGTPPVLRNLSRPQPLARRVTAPARAAIRRAHAAWRR